MSNKFIYLSRDRQKELNQNEFVKMYSELYFENTGFSNKNSHIAEDRIKDILEKCKEKKDISAKDVYDILAWKIGKIRHGASDTNNKIEYYSDWKDGILEGKINGDTINQEQFEEIAKKLNELSEGEDSFEKYIGELTKFTGIGNVYAITLRYFITGGKHPIYDQYAYRAIKAIMRDFSNGVGIWVDKTDVKQYKEESNIYSFIEGMCNPQNARIILKAPDVSSYSVSEMKNVYEEYECWFNQIFGEYLCVENKPVEDIIDNYRKVDQALWVYGHLFK